MTIAVILDGGLVQCVVSDDPAEVGKEVQVIDYDTEGADFADDKLVVVPQNDGSKEIAFLHTAEILKAGIDLDGVRELTDAEKRGDAT